MIEEDRRSSIRRLADDLHIPRMSIQDILTMKLGTNCICSIWVPHFLQDEEMEHPHSVCSENVDGSPKIQTLSRVIIIDKSWIHHCNVKMKCESEAWLHSGELRMKKFVGRSQWAK